MKPIVIVYATTKEHEDQTLIFKSISKLEKDLNISHQSFLSNTASLTQVYNTVLPNINYKNSIIVFVHDDVVIEELFFIEKLNEAMEKYDIVGLAGIKSPINITPQKSLWHLMGSPEQMSGAVAHFTDDTCHSRFMTHFGTTPERVILIDGVFMAVNVERMLETGHRFDENCPAKFHFYDLNFCLDANKKGLKIGTYPIWITHKSHGLKKITPDWLEGQKYFLNKYINQGN